MTTIRGRIYHEMVDIRSVFAREPELIPAGWTIDIKIGATTVIHRAGIPTWTQALERTNYLVNGLRNGTITLGAGTLRHLSSETEPIVHQRPLPNHNG